MSTLTDFPFEFAFTPCKPSTTPSFSFDPSLLEIPYSTGPHAGSQASIYSFYPLLSDYTTDSDYSTRIKTNARLPIRTYGPLLLPKIRPQDSAIGSITAVSPPKPKPKRIKTLTSTAGVCKSSKARFKHSNFANPESSPSVFVQPQPKTMAAPLWTTMTENMSSSQLLCSPMSKPASSYDHHQLSPFMAAATTIAGAMSSMQTQTLMPQPDLFYHHQQTFTPRESSPLASASEAAAPAAGPTSTLISYLTTANPAPALVRTISFPLNDPHTKHFWWDVRQVRPWTAFDASTILSFPGASTLLSTAVPACLLPSLPVTQQHPETEAALYSIYSSYYLPKLNTALSLSSTRPLQLSHPSKSNSAATTTPSSPASDFVFVVNARGETSSATAIFGGKPTARLVGLVKSFDRFNTGMRVDNTKRIKYLKGLAHLHQIMREHGCRYGFILTEIELVFVRNGAEETPHFGYLEVGATQLAKHGEGSANNDETPLTACLALWGLCMLVGDEQLPGHAHWRSEIGAPAEGTRRKALPRDDWMPQPGLAERRGAKRARGWVMPEDAIGRKEIGKRGVRYPSCQME
ncbi:hypothetical protein MGG_02019 [Pyricularia oryzae 70-15]|uniref:Sialidase n=3 Tax=Pyricularia oryzae TaxID=318829 RepID=G4MMS7_PYRO7|nr:uncharacterized protein MGG_02019 [Pyricularia oryzae 70-15]EHA56157.1 hypothetical protein MGG_02019 [Pyricularia oryzae 70-15]ELQ35302.1 hypothetical protein OOU_Y34scaffold00716g3 [Pyricularia oryzae Y34]KAI7909793.1 hypothetical protein M9X92_011447 [Pyricularia oryzae]KAI7909794.1 hypothetical protein M0657_011676 [Pyricularia oryzae]